MDGNTFWVVAQGKMIDGQKQRYEHAVNGTSINLDDPPLKDTYPLSPNYWAILRFRADNPGMWNFHCHYFFHNMMGLQMVFNVAPDRQMRPPDAWFNTFNMGNTLCESDTSDPIGDAPKPNESR